MRITVFGAAGNVGARVVDEALARGHDVTAVVRDPARFSLLPAGADAAVGDASVVEDVVRLGSGRDLVVGATRPARGSEAEHAVTARTLVAGAVRTGARLLVVGGAGSLMVTGNDGTAAIDDPAFVPPAWRGIAHACDEQLAIVRAAAGVDWTYLSPPALLAPGERTGRYRLGTDELIVDADGRSAISSEDLAVALLDEAERPQHRRGRFTVGY